MCPAPTRHLRRRVQRIGARHVAASAPPRPARPEAGPPARDRSPSHPRRPAVPRRVPPPSSRHSASPPPGLDLAARRLPAGGATPPPSGLASSSASGRRPHLRPLPSVAGDREPRAEPAPIGSGYCSKATYKKLEADISNLKTRLKTQETETRKANAKFVSIPETLTSPPPPDVSGARRTSPPPLPANRRAPRHRLRAPRRRGPLGPRPARPRATGPRATRDALPCPAAGAAVRRRRLLVAVPRRRGTAPPSPGLDLAARRLPAGGAAPPPSGLASSSASGRRPHLRPLPSIASDREPRAEPAPIGSGYCSKVDPEPLKIS
nr:protein IQ-DOMAIN 14-like [Aegilops tauschii subsp. strangulata]